MSRRFYAALIATALALVAAIAYGSGGSSALNRVFGGLTVSGSSTFNDPVTAASGATVNGNLAVTATAAQSQTILSINNDQTGTATLLLNGTAANKISTSLNSTTCVIVENGNTGDVFFSANCSGKVLTLPQSTTISGPLTASSGATFSGGPPVFSTAETGLTAHAGGTQAAALALSATKFMHQVTTVGTAADSVALPAPVLGTCHLVANEAAANSMQLFAISPATINGAATATGIAVAAKKGEFCCAASSTDYLCAGI